MGSFTRDSCQGVLLRSLAGESCQGVLLGSIAEESCKGVLVGSLGEESCRGVLLWSLDRESCKGILLGSLVWESCQGVLLGSLGILENQWSLYLSFTQLHPRYHKFCPKYPSHIFCPQFNFLLSFFQSCIFLMLSFIVWSTVLFRFQLFGSQFQPTYFFLTCPAAICTILSFSIIPSLGCFSKVILKKKMKF